MTETQRSDAKTLKERQYYFVKEHLKVLPAYFFISQLDAPIDDENPMTLRRAMMAKSPANCPSNRLIHNVDASWNQPSKHTITSVVGREEEAQKFLINMIPEFLHRFGSGASKWFTGSGLLVYSEVRWNATKGTTSSLKERDSEEMVKEDLWELNDKWEELKTLPSADRPTPNALDTAGSEQELPEKTRHKTRLASDKSIASFGNVYQRPKDADDVIEEAAVAKAAAEMEIDHTGTEFEFSAEQLERDRAKALAGPATEFSMSTAAETTPQTRLKLKKAQEELLASNKEIEKLRKDLAKHAALNPESSVDSDLDDSMTEAEATKLMHQKESHAISTFILRPPGIGAADPNAMEEDENASLPTGQSSSKGK